MAHRLLDRGAAVRVVDTEGGPALIVFGSPAAFSSEFPNARQVSLDAGVSVSSVTRPPRANSRLICSSRLILRRRTCWSQP